MRRDSCSGRFESLEQRALLTTLTDAGNVLGQFGSYREIEVGDLDGDGFADVFVGRTNSGGHAVPDGVYWGDGTGKFTDSEQLLGDLGTRDVALGDLDGDGDLDAFTIGAVVDLDSDRNGQSQVWTNDGAGGMSGSWTSSLLPSSTLDSVSLGDVDGDGDLDAIQVRSGGNLVWTNDGNGEFTDSGQSLGVGSSSSVALGDLDGDGDLDFVVGDLGSDTRVWKNDGSGVFTDSGLIIGGRVEDVSLGDLDNDGELDLIVARENGQSDEVLLNDGTGTFTSVQSIGTFKTQGLELGDLDGDGDLDALLSTNTPTALRLYLNDGSGVFAASDILSEALIRDFEIHDIDNDGHLDVLAPNRLWENGTPTEAPSLIVTTDQDVVDDTDFVTSLREAIAFANSDPDASVITFYDGSIGAVNFNDSTPETIVLGGTQLVISSDITITGPGSGLLTVSGNNASRVFEIANGDHNVTFHAMTIANGRIQRNIVSNANAGTGVRILSSGTVNIIESTLRGNYATSYRGGAIYNGSATLNVIASTLFGNYATNAGTIYTHHLAATHLLNSTVSGSNFSVRNGSALTNRGTLTLLNSTVLGRSDHGTPVGGRVPAEIHNSIVINLGVGGHVAGDVFGSNNTIGGDASLVLDTNLADNGGPTLTHALIPGSPAINAGNDTLAVDGNGTPLMTDQRGDGFNRVVGTVDIGAFEIQNQAPVADAGGPYTVNEGSSIVLDASHSTDDNDSIVTYEWDLDYDGSTFDVDTTDVSAFFDGIDDETRIIALRVRDSFGTESNIATSTVTVNNVAPAITRLTTDASSLLEKSDNGVVTLSGSVTDAGLQDTHTVVVNWGDGTEEILVSAGDFVAAPDFSWAQHAYANGGIYAVTLTVTDDDGHTSVADSTAVVTGVGVVDGVLYVIGTNGNDIVNVKEVNSGARIKVTTQLNVGRRHGHYGVDVRYFDIAHVSSIEMHLCGGNDRASLSHQHWWHSHSVDIPAVINGGDGNDRIQGGSAADILDGGNGHDVIRGGAGEDKIMGGEGHDWIDAGSGDDIVYAGAGNDIVWGGRGSDIVLGQSGNDMLVGGSGRDFLIGGTGLDLMYGSWGGDIMITGDTNFDSDEDKLKQTRDLWGSSDSVFDRQTAILNLGLEVIHDRDMDFAWGGWGTDWLLFDSALDYSC